MATITRAELVSLALDKLGVIASGQSAEAEDEQKVDEAFDRVVDELAAKGVIGLGDYDEIEAAWAGALAELLANEVAPAFGKSSLPPQATILIEARLRRIVAGSPTYETLKAEYY